MNIQIQHVPLLQVQRDLHDMPRSMERFNEYLRTILGEKANGQDEVIYPPMIAMNPMGREHVAEKLDKWLSEDGESIANQAIDEAIWRLAEDTEEKFTLESAQLQHGLVIIDDVQGGWTNRYTTEAALLFENSYAAKHHWIVTPLWASEGVSQSHLHQEVLRAIYRTLHILQHGLPTTLRQMMFQEGAAAHFARVQLRLDEDDIAYSQEVIAPYLDHNDYPLLFAAMYGDVGAKLLGYEPLGLSPQAGFEVALSSVRCDKLKNYENL